MLKPCQIRWSAWRNACLDWLGANLVLQTFLASPHESVHEHCPLKMFVQGRYKHKTDISIIPFTHLTELWFFSVVLVEVQLLVAPASHCQLWGMLKNLWEILLTLIKSLQVLKQGTRADFFMEEKSFQPTALKQTWTNEQVFWLSQLPLCKHLTWK